MEAWQYGSIGCLYLQAIYCCVSLQWNWFLQLLLGSSQLLLGSSENPGSPWFNVCGNSSSCSWSSGQISQTLDAKIKVTVQSGSESASLSFSFVVNNNNGDPGCDAISPNRVCK